MTFCLTGNFQEDRQYTASFGKQQLDGAVLLTEQTFEISGTYLSLLRNPQIRQNQVDINGLFPAVSGPKIGCKILAEIMPSITGVKLAIEECN